MRRAVQGRFDLQTSDIHLWLAFYEQLNPAQLDRCCKLLNPEEWVRYWRFHFERDRRCYLVTRALVRSVLPQYLPITSHELRFATNAYGRPSCVNQEAIDASIIFNLSHSGGLVVLAITCARALGVDIEDLGAPVSSDLAHRYFAPEESAALTTLPSSLQQERFLEYWTMKESYIKAREKGLSIPLDQFSFRFVGDDRVEFSRADDDANAWQFWQLRPTARHVMAICAEQIPSETRLTVLTVAPGEPPKQFDAECRRVS